MTTANEVFYSAQSSSISSNSSYDSDDSDDAIPTLISDDEPDATGDRPNEVRPVGRYDARPKVQQRGLQQTVQERYRDGVVHARPTAIAQSKAAKATKTNAAAKRGLWRDAQDAVRPLTATEVHELPDPKGFKQWLERTTARALTAPSRSREACGARGNSYNAEVARKLAEATHDCRKMQAEPQGSRSLFPCFCSGGASWHLHGEGATVRAYMDAAPCQSSAREANPPRTGIQ